MAEAAKDSQLAPAPLKEAALAKPSWSSGVVFYPPSDKYWRIGGKWYDFTRFLEKHPGGSKALLDARDRFEDCTFVFEAHHHNYQRARAVIKQYEVSEEEVKKAGLNERPKTDKPRAARDDKKGDVHHDRALQKDEIPKLMGDDSFYSVLRRRVTEHLRSVGHPAGGPTKQCIALFWANFALWVAGVIGMWHFGSVASAVFLGIVSSWLGAFGHNWVHLPAYKSWAYLSLDTVGFSSDGWCREHNLQHHMYTNTPWDNHYHGTEPFLVTDPTVKRNWLQRNVFPYLNTVMLCFGLWANWIAHLVELAKGREVLSTGKLIIPTQIAFMVWRWGLWGLVLQFICGAVLGMYYFTLALMNHNAEHCMDIRARNASADWGEAQLRSSADWSVGLSFLGAGRYLWLNFHTVHHLFPRIDFSHHSAIQQILVKTCAEMGIDYRAGQPFEIWCEMVKTFGTPRSLLEEVVVYAGGI